MKSLEGALGKVGSEPSQGMAPRGIGFEIFQQLNRREIDFGTYLEMNAITVARSAYEFQPTSFPVLPGLLKSYCEERIQERRECDLEAGKRLGIWVKQVFAIGDRNTKNTELLLWAIEILAPTGLTGEIGSIRDALPRFERVKFPAEDFRLATRTQVLDAGAREQRSRS